jgi:hypothetical protein
MYAFSGKLAHLMQTMESSRKITRLMPNIFVQKVEDGDDSQQVKLQGIRKPCRPVPKAWFLLLSRHCFPDLFFLPVLDIQVPGIQPTDYDHYRGECEQYAGGECVAWCGR